MSLERAVQLLQLSERARQGRLRAQFMKEIHLKERRGQHRESNSTQDPNISATVIQKVHYYVVHVLIMSNFYTIPKHEFIQLVYLHFQHLVAFYPVKTDHDFEQLGALHQALEPSTF